MDLIRKWWWIVLIGIIVGLGVVNFNKLILKKSGERPTGRTVATNQKTQVAVGNKTVSLEKQVTAEVVTWNSSNAELTFKISDSQQTEKITVDSDQMSIFVPEAQHKTNGVLPVKNKDKNWQSAFCPQDGLTIGYDGSGAIRMLFNTGYRMCGFKE
jgi:hypothetical protein